MLPDRLLSMRLVTVLPAEASERHVSVGLEANWLPDPTLRPVEVMGLASEVPSVAIVTGR